MGEGLRLPFEWSGVDQVGVSHQTLLITDLRLIIILFENEFKSRHLTILRVSFGSRALLGGGDE